MSQKSTFGTAAYGGSHWQPRERAHSEELGSVWSACGLENEWQALKSVVLHSPGDELLAAQENPDAVQMLQPLDIIKAQEEHAQLAETYRSQGVDVYFVEPAGPVSPNLMFCADLMAMTPEGAILARPASVVRAGEERNMQACLARLGIPILKTLNGNATFEGADLIWLNRKRAILGRGLRTNSEAIVQISGLLEEIHIEVLPVDMPYGTMHLMGMLRIVDDNLALAWPRRTPHRAVMALRESGYEVAFLPDLPDFEQQKAFNFVTLGSRKILMVADNPGAKSFYESLNIECIETPASELAKAAGAVGCLSGILHRAIDQG
ncbi:MAG: arginine deiminase-related protein [Pseudomonadota bacterium]